MAVEMVVQASRKPTPKQYKVFKSLKKLLDKNPYCPSIEEIGRDAKMSKAATYALLRGLREKGYVTWDPEAKRSFEIIAEVR
jgi:DNA-binding IclR family transcriptional regulator